MTGSPAQPAADATAPAGRRRGFLLLSAFAVAGIAILCSLGFWQLQRLTWKEGVIAQMRKQMQAPAKDLPAPGQWPAIASPQAEYRTYRATGRFDHGKEALIFRAAGKGSLGPAYHVVTPMYLTGGGTVLVNRGFVPEAKRSPATRTEGQIDGPVTITGYLRLAEARNIFTPADTPDKGIWYSRDPKAMARFLKLENAAPFILEADATPNPGGWPKGGVTSVKIPNNHLPYAWTWFGLAATLAGVYIAYLIRWRSRSA
jgi:surfeit locus 1 family protein